MLPPQLVARINADEIAHSRSFSTETRPSTATATTSPIVRRHFNTSRTLKAVNDSSTMDFAFLPEIVSPEDVGVSAIRVPILPDVNYNQSTNTANVVEEAVVMMPQISSMVSSS